MPDQTAVFRRQARQALDDARRRDGLLHAQVGRQANPDGSEAIAFVTVWRDLPALYAWLGGTDLLDTPVLSSGDSAVFEYYEVQHFESYEVAETDLDEAEATPFVAALDARG